MLSPYDRMLGRSIRRVSILLSHEILAGKCAIREPQISIIPNHGGEPIGGLEICAHTNAQHKSSS